ncbi:MAG TPA: tetratricopeptide repeat protein [Candidatus Cybelea sp.]
MVGTGVPPDVSLDSIISRHVTALGGQKAIASIKSFIERGWYREGKFEIDTFTAQMRPFYRVIGDPRSDPLGEIHEGYDGAAWEYYPDPGIVVRTVGAAADATRHAAAFDDALVNGARRGIRLTLEAPATVLETREYTIRTVLADGFTEDIFVNPSTWMIDAEKRVVPMHAFGKRYTTIDVLSDYRPEGGVPRAHVFKEIDEDTGDVLTQSAVTSVEINPALPLSMFSPPTWNRTPLQQLIQRIYDERDEPRSVMATYRDFTRLIDVRAAAVGDAVDFVGYQCLKMGHADTAVSLLLQNVADHPNSATAHFGLGRAYEAMGNRNDAKTQYRRALAIDPNYQRARDALAALR